MAVIHRKTAMVHVTKTGGTWCIVAMQHGGIKQKSTRRGTTHSGIKEVYNEIRGKFIFAFVRHPLTWYQSWWSYSHYKKRTKEPFNVYLDRILDEEPELYHHMVLERLGYVKEGGQWVKSDPMVDFVGKYENLADDLVKALRLGGEEFNEELLRATPPKRVVGQSDKYTSQSIYGNGNQDRLLQQHRDAMELLGYDQ